MLQASRWISRGRLSESLGNKRQLEEHDRAFTKSSHLNTNLNFTNNWLTLSYFTVDSTLVEGETNYASSKYITFNPTYLLICTNECTIFWLKYYTNISLLYNYTAPTCFDPLRSSSGSSDSSLLSCFQIFKIIIKLYYYKIYKITCLYGRYCCSISVNNIRIN